ncbi:hypothetical protein [Micromonospora okii]|uniref:hypothetical protein n=1 Tax=Micromonospora okii TaxID=1182970 RepID=UPI001E3FFA23|nr:hypothetical protein [Micromonospora okii]
MSDGYGAGSRRDELLVPVLLFLSLFFLAGFLALLFVPATGWIGVVVPLLLVLLALTSWRLRHGGWRGGLPPGGARRLVGAGGACLLLWALGMVIASTTDLIASPAHLTLLGASAALMSCAGLVGRRGSV